MVASTASAAEPVSGDVLLVPTSGRGGIPDSGVDAVIATVTAVDPVEPGYATVFECGQGLPDTSNVNVADGAVPNTAVVPVSGDGMICVYRSAPFHVIVDVTGWIAGGAAIEAMPETRAFDSRQGARIQPGEVRRVSMGAHGVPSGAAGVVANVTATAATAPGFVSLFPCASGVTETSNVNFEGGVDRANLSVLALDPANEVCISASAPTHVIVDVSAWTVDVADLEIPVPRRLADTRTTGVPVQPDSPLRVEVGSADSVVLNVTSTRQNAPGYLTVYPCDGELPLASAGNFDAGRDAASTVLARPSATGEVCVWVSTHTDIVVDLQAVGQVTSGLRSVPPARLVDTRTAPRFAPNAAGDTYTLDDVETGTTLRGAMGMFDHNIPIDTLRHGDHVVTATGRGGDSPRQQVDVHRGGQLLWSVELGDDPADQFLLAGSDDERVYLLKTRGECNDSGGCWWSGDLESTVVAMDLHAGVERWQSDVGQSPRIPGVEVDDAVVVVANGDELVALDPATGQERWRRATTSAANEFGGTSITDRLTVVESKQGSEYYVYEEVQSLDPTTGDAEWTTPIPVRSTCSFPSRLLRSGSDTIITDNFLMFSGVDATTGELLWTKNFTDEGPIDTSFGGQDALITHDGDVVVLVDGFEGDSVLLVRLDRRTGDVVWRRAVPEAAQFSWRVSQMALIGNTVVVDLADGDVRGTVVDTSSLLIRVSDGEVLSPYRGE